MSLYCLHKRVISRSISFIIAVTVFLVTAAAYADSRSNAAYPADNDTDYRTPPRVDTKNSIDGMYPADNDSAYTPTVLKEHPRKPPAQEPVQQESPYPMDNDAEYKPGKSRSGASDDDQPVLPPADNDSDYKQPQPKGSDGDKYFYPLYY